MATSAHDHMESRSRAEAAGRAAAGKGSAGGSSGRPGGVGNVGQVNSKPTTTSYGAPIHYDNSSNPVTRGITLAASPDLNKKNVARTDMYNEAARAWNATTGRSFGNFVNKMAPMGFAMEPPDINRPATFGGGDYHLGVNPAKFAASVLSPYGSSLALGPIAGGAYNALGGKNLVLGGPGDMGMSSWHDLPGQGSQSTGPVGPQSPGKPTEGGGMRIPGPVQAPSIMSPQAAQQAPAVKPPAIFPKPPVMTQFQVPGGAPYGFNLFGRAA